MNKEMTARIHAFVAYRVKRTTEGCRLTYEEQAEARAIASEIGAIVEQDVLAQLVRQTCAGIRS